ncbi:MAG: glycosyltransferase WbuB [Micavibrio sp.]|nr:glycosyltransferase WbuB [Micavibrio sp.]
MVKRKPSILFINRVLPPQRGATGRMLSDLALGFAKDGWKVTVVTTGTDHPVPSQIKKKANIEVFRVGKTAEKTKLGYLKALIQMSLKGCLLPRHDIVVTMTDPPLLALAGRLVQIFRSSRHIHWCQDLYPDLFPVVGAKLPSPLIRIFKNLTRKALKKADKIIVLGRCMARQLTHSGVEPSRISVIPNWYSAKMVMPKTGRKDAEPQNTKFRILYTGTLSYIHPYSSIVEAAEKLQETHPDIEIVFAGAGSSYKRLAEIRAEKRLSNIKLLPFQPNSKLPALIESGDVHLVTLSEKATGLSVPSKFYNSFAAERPVIFIGSKSSEIARTITDYKCGTVVSPDNVNALILAIESYRENEKVWFEAQKGAEQAAKVFTPEQSIQIWLEKAQSVVTNGQSK